MDGKTMEGKILANQDRFTKFASVSHHQCFALYGNSYYCINTVLVGFLHSDFKKAVFQGTYFWKPYIS